MLEEEEERWSRKRYPFAVGSVAPPVIARVPILVEEERSVAKSSNYLTRLRRKLIATEEARYLGRVISKGSGSEPKDIFDKKPRNDLTKKLAHGTEESKEVSRTAKGLPIQVYPAQS